MSDEGRSIEEIAADLNDQRAKVRELTKENQKIPALNGEIERLKNENEKLSGRYKDAQADLADMDEELGKLQSKLRAQGDVEKEIQQAQADRADALGEKDAAIEERQGLGNKLGEANARIADLEAEVKRLSLHEEQTKLLNEALNKAKELS